MIGAVVEQFGRLDIAFNNAGITAYKPIENLTTDDVDQVLATNVRGVLLLVKHEVAQTRKQGHGGSIVNTSSVAATGGSANLSIYAASKGALDAMVRAVALEIGRDRIRINNVSPGVIDAPLTSVLPEASFVTGQSILVDGGYNIGGMR